MQGHSFSNKNQLIVLTILWALFCVFVVKPWQLFFLNDDFMHIPDARVLLRSGFMRPVPNVFLWMDRILYGDGPLGFFITSVLLHGFSVFSSYLLVSVMQSRLGLLKEYTYLPFLTAMLFLVYPFHAESIMWTIARVSTMATAFTLLSLVFFIKANDLKNYFIVSWLLLLIALFSYESMWNVIPLFLLIAWYKASQSIVTKQIAIAQSIIMVVTFLGYLGLRFVLLDSLVGNGYDHMESNLKNIPLVVSNLVKLVARIYTPAINNSITFTSLFLILTLFLGYFTFKQYRTNRGKGFFLLILWAAMVTGVLTAAPLGIDTHFHESDRYIHYASFFFCLFIAIFIYSFPKRGSKIFVASGILSVFTIGFLILQSHYAFSSSVTRGTVEWMQKQPSGKKLVFIDVPERYKGALIFRISLPEAIDWYAPACKPSGVLIFSSVRSFNKEGNFKTGSISLKEFGQLKGTGFLKDLNNLIKADSTKNVLIFWYGNGGLWRVLF